MKASNVSACLLSLLFPLTTIINALPYNPAAVSASFAAHAAVVVASPTPVAVPPTPSVEPGAAPLPSNQPTDGGINSTDKEPTKDFPDVGQDEGLDDDEGGSGGEGDSGADRGGGGTSAENKE